MIASDVASRAGGIWFSVRMCEGICGDACGTATSSCTFRSKIIEEAGECVRGEADRIPRGDDATPYGLFLEGDPGERRLSMLAKGETGLRPPGESICAVGDLVFFLSSSFLPNLKKSRFLALSSVPAPESVADRLALCDVDSETRGA